MTPGQFKALYYAQAGAESLPIHMEHRTGFRAAYGLVYRAGLAVHATSMVRAVTVLGDNLMDCGILPSTTIVMCCSILTSKTMH